MSPMLDFHRLKLLTAYIYMSEFQSLEQLAREQIHFAVTKEAMTRNDPSLRRALHDAAETVASHIISLNGGDLLEFALRGPALMEHAVHVMADAVRTDPNLRAHLIGLRAAVRLRRKLLDGSIRETNPDERRQMAEACAEAYCRHHLEKGTASLATLLAHEGPGIRLAAMRLSAIVAERASHTTGDSTGGRSR